MCESGLPPPGQALFIKMTLRDQHGEIDVPFAQDFEYKGATFCVVCPDSEYSKPDAPAICVRMVKGPVELEGKRYAIAENGHRPLFAFTGELVAQQVRLYRLGGLQIEAPKKSTPRKAKNQPARKHYQQPETTASLF